MGKLNRDISGNYAKYDVLVRDRKHTVEKIIQITGKKHNRNDVYYKESPVRHSSIEDEIKLLVELKVTSSKDFKFKLRCNTLTAEPFFRFDSAGPHHRNDKDDIPLDEQMITTPHFNYYDEKGKLLAYKSAKLLDENEAKALEDISFCFVHFCNEVNMRYPPDDFSEIISTLVGELNLDTNEDDILVNAKF